jgi:hypothetical protein
MTVRTADRLWCKVVPAAADHAQRLLVAAAGAGPAAVALKTSVSRYPMEAGATVLT